MKQIIRLTESDLHSIIRESVSQILSELDWKTYASASDKSLDRGNTRYWRDKGETGPGLIKKAVGERERSKRFGQAAKDAFNRDYGYKRGRVYDDDYAEVKLGGDFDATEEFGPHAIGLKDKGYGNPAKYEHGRNRENFQKVTPDEFFDGNQEAAQSFKNADAEVKNWKRGNAKYIKGKGWK